MMKELICLLSIFVVVLVQSEVYRKPLSTVDRQLIEFAHSALRSSFRDDQGLQSPSIRRLRSGVDLQGIRRIFTVEFQVKTFDLIYQCPVSIYDDPVGHIRALVRSIVCLSRPDDDQSLTNLVYPIEDGTTISVEDLEQFDYDYDRDLFETFVQIHRKSFRNEQEKTRRLSIFKENLNRIEQLNVNEQGTAIYGITHLADLTEGEFTQVYLNPRLADATKKESPAVNPMDVSPPAFDWRNLSAVTDVKNQGQCGSCWAFSVTGNIEGVWKVKSDQLVSLSEQELVDCDKVDQGCNGGYMNVAYDQIISMHGLMSEEDYKYEGKQHSQCQLDPKKIRVTINSYLNISSDENEMAEWLANNAPISIGLNANMMQFYFRGVAHPHRSLCNPQGLNHGVLLVGYGLEDKRSKSIPFWIIKNSWGPHWGEKGYYRLYRGDGSCGVNLMCSSAIVN